MMENMNQIGLKFGKKLIYHLYIPRDIFEVYEQMRKLLVIVVFISVYALMDINLLCSSCLKTWINFAQPLESSSKHMKFIAEKYLVSNSLCNNKGVEESI